MQRVPALVLLTHRQAAFSAVRAFSHRAPLLSRASKDRARRVKWVAPAAPSIAQATTLPGQAGTDAARPATQSSGLFEGDPAGLKVDEIKPEDLEREMLAGQDVLREEVDGGGRENLAGTAVGSGGAPSAPSSSAEGEAAAKGEVVYTATPPYSVPLMLSVCFVMSVFCLACADFARVGVEQYDEETGKYEVTPAWKRYSLAGGAATIGVGIAVWGSLAPTRVVTKMTLRRVPASLHSPLPFPRDSLITLEACFSPLTPLLRKLGQKPRTVPLARMRLLGPISDSPKPYHPLIRSEVSKPPSRLSTLFGPLRAKYLAPPSRKPAPTPWNSRRLSHSPFVVEGDRMSYSLAVKRAPAPYSDKGAWCKDWDALERALLGVDEAKWTKR
ncbi:hypothetical protein JCM3770_004930 [Rhodotorula araucariae]